MDVHERDAEVQDTLSKVQIRKERRERRIVWEVDAMTVQKKKYFCNWCAQPVIFDDKFRSKNDKAIPLNLDHTPHDCLESPYAKRKKQSEAA